MADAPVRTPPSLDEHVAHDYYSRDGSPPARKFLPVGIREGTKRNLFEASDSESEHDLRKGTGQARVVTSHQQTMSELYKLYKAHSGTLSNEEKDRFLLLLLTRYNELMAAEAGGAHVRRSGPVQAAGGLQGQLPQSIPTTMPLRFKRKATEEEQKENPFPKPSKYQWPRANFGTRVVDSAVLSAGSPSTEFSSLGNVESDAPRKGTAPKPEKDIYCRKCSGALHITNNVTFCPYCSGDTATNPKKDIYCGKCRRTLDFTDKVTFCPMSRGDLDLHTYYKNAELKVCHEEKVPATEAAFQDFYGSSNGSAWSAPLSGQVYRGLGGALSKNGTANTREPSGNEKEGSYVRRNTGLNNTSWGAGDNDTDTRLDANGGRAGGNSNWDEGSVGIAPKSSHWGSTSVCSDTSARTTLDNISGSGIDLRDANNLKAKSKTSVPTGYTVTYWATIEAGDQVVNIPIDSANVSGPEKTIIDGSDSGMMKAWKWMQEKGLADEVGLQDAFDLAKELQGEVTKTTGQETLGQEEDAEEQSMGDAFGDYHMGWSSAGVRPGTPSPDGWGY